MRFITRAVIVAAAIVGLLLLSRADVDWTGRDSAFSEQLNKWRAGLTSDGFAAGSTTSSAGKSRPGIDNFSGWSQCTGEGGPDNQHTLIKSIKGGEYFKLDFGDKFVSNPNILPDPKRPGHFIMAAQEVSDGSYMATYACEASWRSDGVLSCDKNPTKLPIVPDDSGKCYTHPILENIKGGRDLRLFWGPDTPYVVYGTQSRHACFGLAIQNFRELYPSFDEHKAEDPFKEHTELDRPFPRAEVEKNWFVFWDADDKQFVHHDIWPERVFAELHDDGSVSRPIARRAKDDFACMEKHMPEVAPELESIHQSTNALKVTLCKRGECVPSSDNTVLLSIFQYKTFYRYHALYEPYLFLYSQDAPYELIGMSKRALWIDGRGLTDKPQWVEFGDTAMFYIVSMTWKTHGNQYHGFLDDEIFLNFGIEDTSAGAIDIKASDLLQCLIKCGSP
ncbi:hypothetical protein PYCC9005_003600 [Savitreella phatthalungensis]